MNTITILAIIAMVVVVILFFEFIRQVYRIKHGRTGVGRWQILINRFLVLVLVVCLGWMGMTAYASHRRARPAPAPAVSSSASSQRPATKLQLTVPKKVTMDENGAAKVKITVSAGAKVEVRGLRTDTSYGHFTAVKDHATTKKVTLEYAGEYEVVATKGKQRVTKKVTVETGESDSSSSVVSSSSVSSAVSQRSSSSTASASVSHATPAASSARATGGNAGASRVNGGYHPYRPYQPSQPAYSSPTQTTPAGSAGAGQVSTMHGQ